METQYHSVDSGRYDLLYGVDSGHVNYITTDKKGDAPFCFEASPFCVLFKIVFF